jgi:hypothetical protein
MQTIVLGTDFSETASNGVDFDKKKEIRIN